MIAATASEAKAAFDCSVVNPGGVSWGSGGVGSTGFTGAVAVRPGLACVPLLGTGFSPGGTTDLPLGNIDGSPLCEQVVNVQGTLNFPAGAFYIYPANTAVNLECVRGALNVVKSNIVNFSADSLTDVGNDIYVESNSALLDVTFDTMTMMGVTGFDNDIVIKANPGLLSVSFPVLDTINGKLQVISNGTLPDLNGFPSLIMVSSLFKIDNNALLDLNHGEFPVLDAVGGSFQVSGNNDMTVVSLPTLTTIASQVSGPGLLITNNNLTDLDLSGLVDMNRSFILTREPNLMNAGIVPMNALFTHINSGGGLVISLNDSLDNLNAFSTLTDVAAEVLIDSNDVMTSIAGLAGLNTIGGSLTVRGNDALTDFSFPNIVILDRLEMRNNISLIDFGFPTLTIIGSDLTMHGNTMLPDVGLTTVGFPLLDTVTTQIYIHANTSMTSFNLPALTVIGWKLWVEYNYALANVALPALTRIGAVPKVPPAPNGVVDVANNDPALIGAGWVLPVGGYAGPLLSANATTNGAGFCPVFAGWVLLIGAGTSSCTP